MGVSCLYGGLFVVACEVVSELVYGCCDYLGLIFRVLGYACFGWLSGQRG